MRRFVCRILFFLLLLLLLLVIVRGAVIHSRPKDCFNPSISTIVLGNSRIKNGIDDSLLPTCWAMGFDAANFNLLYYRLKMLHVYNPQLRKVVLGADRAGLYSYSASNYYYFNPYLWDYLSLDDWFFLLRYDREALLYMFDWKKVLYPLFSTFHGDDTRTVMLGGFDPNYDYRLYESLALEPFDDLIVDDNTPIHSLQVYYLDKIYDYCKANGITLEFLNMPSYPTEKVIQINRRTRNLLRERYPDVPFHDYELTVLPDSCYFDIYHLNYDGALVFSALIRSDLFP